MRNYCVPDVRRKNIFLIFELSLIYTLGLGIVKINFPSALDFCYI